MPKAIDITNQRFGELIAIKKVESQKKKTRWLCKCDCGNETIVQTTHLKSGAITSCGCQRHNNPNISKHKIEKECALCGKTFETNSYNKKYCYECSPSQVTTPSNERLKQHKRKIKHILVTYKGGKCEICGYDKCEGALQFHHRNPNEKDFVLSKANLSKYTLDELYKEVDKCDLLCANCHAEKHFT
jgi:hypothetical protein